MPFVCFAQTWIPRADVGGPGRYYGVGFSIGGKGYLGTGHDLFDQLADFWEYDPQTDVWAQKTNYGGGQRNYACGFAMGNKGYIGLGNGNFGDTNDFWEYNPQTNTWLQKADFPGVARGQAIAFSIGNKGYMGIGNYNDFYEWNGDTLSPTYNTWIQRTSFPGGSGTRREAVTFTIGKKGYVVTGANPLFYKEVWEYDGDTASITFNTWAQKSYFGGTGRYGAVGFAIGNKGYVATGESADSTRGDFWEWDQASDVWIQKPYFSGGARYYAVGFAIGNKGYVGTGYNNTANLKYDFWEYCDTCPAVGINELEQTGKLFLYPNPAVNELNIVLPGLTEEINLELEDINGKLVLQQHFKINTQLDVSMLPKGVYVVRIIGVNINLSKRVILIN